MPKDSHLKEAPPASASVRLLHPYFVLRVAGEPCARWHRLHDGATGAALQQMQAWRERIAQIGPAACAALESAIALAGEQRDARRALLTAKRAVFNGKPFTLDDEVIAACCAPDQSAVLAELKELAAQLGAAASGFAALFDTELARSVQRLRSAAFDAPALMGGIHHTNAQLHALVERWLRDGAPSEGKSVRRLQSTLLDYAMRAAFKTSPLSSFTPVIAGAWRSGASVDIDLGERAMSTKVRFNHAWLLDLLEGVWRDPACVGDEFPLALNPTIRIDNAELHWQQLMQSDSRHGKFWGAAHPQRKIALSTPVSILIATAAQMDGPLNLATITRALARQLPAHAHADVRYFVETMLALNLLHPRWERFEQDDLLADTLQLSKQLQGPMREQLGAGAEVSKLATRYEKADLDARVPLRRQIEEAAESMRGLPGRSSAPVFFEDCGFDGARLLADPDQWQAILDDLRAWLALQPLFDKGTPLQSWLAGRFIAAHGADGVCTDIEGFIRELGPLPEMTPCAAMLTLKNAVLDAALGAGDGQAEVRLDAAWCDALAQRMPATVRRRGVSQVFFGQRAGPAGFVVNRVYPGASMLMSRFMTALSEPELASVRAYIGSRSPDGRYLELPGVFGFNGNLHPRLAEGEVLLAGARAGSPGLVRHNMSELCLVYNAATDRLDVRDASGMAHDLYYFGFLLARNLPQAYQLLARNVSTIPELWEALRDRHDEQPLHLPRVSVGTVVVSRRTWIIPRALLPDPAAPVHAFALALHALRVRFALPAEVFVRLGASLSKPFYVHLDSPLHVRQLAGALRTTESSACLQEALPQPGVGTVRWKGRDHVAEMQIELTLTGESTKTSV